MTTLEKILILLLIDIVTIFIACVFGSKKRTLGFRLIMGLYMCQSANILIPLIFWGRK